MSDIDPNPIVDPDRIFDDGVDDPLARLPDESPRHHSMLLEVAKRPPWDRKTVDLAREWGYYHRHIGDIRQRHSWDERLNANDRLSERRVRRRSEVALAAAAGTYVEAIENTARLARDAAARLAPSAVSPTQLTALLSAVHAAVKNHIPGAEEARLRSLEDELAGLDEPAGPDTTADMFRRIAAHPELVEQIAAIVESDP